MKIFVLPFLFASFAISPVSAQISPLTTPLAEPAKPAAPVPVPPDAVVATVDGKKYTAAEVDRLISGFASQQQSAARANPAKALNLALLMRYLSDEALKEKLDQQSPLKEQLEVARLGALAQAKINQVQNFDLKVEAEDEQKFYRENRNQFQEAKVKVIYIAFTSAAAKPDVSGKKTLSEADAKAKIEDLAKQIKAGADFGKLARENSDDKESSAKDGDFGVIKRSSPYPDQIKTAVFALKAGEVSDPVRQPNGFYLLRVETQTTLPFDQVRTQIYDQLKSKGFGEWMQGVQKRFEVKVENPAYFAPKPGVPAPGAPPVR